jgi:hypothetical protein
MLVATQVPWCGESASVACLATIIARLRDATQYFNQTRFASVMLVTLDLRPHSRRRPRHLNVLNQWWGRTGRSLS